MANNPINEQELEMVEVQHNVDMAEALTRLYDNADFNKVILEGYIKQKALDGVSLLGAEYVKIHGKRPEVMEQLVAISTLQDHFATVFALGAIPEDTDLDEDE